MSIILPYFITILLSFPLILPTDGWVQWQFAFPNKATCEEFLDQEYESLFVNVTQAFITMNRVLGHKTPKLRIPKQKRTVPRV